MKIPRCVYCGSPAVGRDHILPLRHYDLLEYGPHQGAVTVPACAPCNSSAGATYFETFEKKAHFLFQKALAENRVDWAGLEESLAKLEFETTQTKEDRERLRRFRLQRCLSYPPRVCRYCRETFKPTTARQEFHNKECCRIFLWERRSAERDREKLLAKTEAKRSKVKTKIKKKPKTSRFDCVSSKED